MVKVKTKVIFAALLIAAGAAAIVAAKAWYARFTSCGGPAVPAAPVPDSRRRELLSDTVPVPAGKFLMGSAEDEGQSEEHPRHEVYLGAYRLGRREVTVGQYKKFAADSGRPMREQPAWSTDSHPVVRVNWCDATAYCEWAGGRLPTEAEWEKAASWGRKSDYDLEADYKLLDEYSWDSVNSSNLPRPVGTKKPNGLGLYDMRGNVWEWVADRFGRRYYADSPDRDPRGPSSGSCRVLRGGSVRYDGTYLRMAYRGSNYPGFTSDDIGFRCAAGGREK